MILKSCFRTVRISVVAIDYISKSMMKNPKNTRIQEKQYIQFIYIYSYIDIHAGNNSVVRL